MGLLRIDEPWYEQMNETDLANSDFFLSGIPVTINLAFDDKSIIKSVKELLSELRAGHNPRTNYTQADFDDWEKYRVLQIFDLDIWQEITGTKITDSLMARVLWSDFDENAPVFDAKDVLRRTAREKVQKVINPLTAIGLQIQLDVQEANRRSESGKDSS
jgi:hypothetical protein